MDGEYSWSLAATWGERCHNEKTGGGQRARKADEARLIDAFFVHSMNDHDPRREADTARQVNPGRNGLVTEVEHGVPDIDRMQVNGGDPTPRMRVLQTSD